MEKNSSVFSFRRDHDYYYQVQHYWQGLLRFRLSISKGQKNVYESLCHGRSSMIISKSKQDIWLAEKVRTINVGPVQQQQNGLDCGVTCQSLCYKSYIHNNPNVIFQKLMCPDLIKCLKSGRMGQCPAVILP